MGAVQTARHPQDANPPSFESVWALFQEIVSCFAICSLLFAHCFFLNLLTLLFLEKERAFSGMFSESLLTFLPNGGYN